jgi:hypothetical protein
MQDSSSLNTAAQKAKWWQQRLALDARMAALLQQLDKGWLGAWRCLLMQPGQQQVEAAAAAAAAGFVAEYFEYFEFVFGELQLHVLVKVSICTHVQVRE